MLQTLHDRLKGAFAIGILAVLAVVFIFWGVEFVSVGGVSGTTGIEVNGEDVPTARIREAYQNEYNQLQAVMPEGDLPAELKTEIQQRVTDAFITQELVRQRTEELGFHVSDAEVVGSLATIPVFQVDGKFSKDAYYGALQAQNISPAVFEQEQKQSLLAQQLDRGLSSSAFALPHEAEAAVRLREATREIAWAVVPAASFAGSVTLDEAALTAWYEQNGNRFQSPETATVEYVELSLQALADGATVSEEGLRGYYEENRDRFSTPERRRARHILIENGDDAAAAEKLAGELSKRAQAGEDFAALAKQYSKDPGSAEQGGDLGWAEKNIYVGAFGDALWALAPGQISAPVKTEFGFHVIKLEEVEAGTLRTFDEVRAEIEPEYRTNQTEQRFGELQEQLDAAAFEAAGDLASVAQQLSLPLRRVEAFTRTGGSVELGNDPRLIALVFNAEMIGGQQARTLELAPGRVVAVRTAAHRPAAPRPLAEVRAEAEQAARADLARAEARRRAEAAVATLSAGTPWPSVAAPYGAAAPQFVGRSAPGVPTEVLRAAFRAPRPAVVDTAAVAATSAAAAATGTAAPSTGVTAATSGNPPAGVNARFGVEQLANGDAAFWTVTAERPGVMPATPAARQEAMSGARIRNATADAATYVSRLRETADVAVNPTLFE